MGTQSRIDNSLFRSGGTGLLSNAKFVKAFLGGQTTGNFDLYTVPANKRALISYVHATSTSGNGTAYAQVNSSSTYYPVANAVTFGSGNSSGLLGLNNAIILDAGEVISVNATAGTANNFWARILEFDAASPTTVKSVKSYTNAIGVDTVYTCPANKTAIILDGSGTMTGMGGFQWYNNTGSSIGPTNIYLVPNGGSAGSTNIVIPSTTNAAGFKGLVLVASMAAGDSIQIDLSTAVSTANTIWLNVVEI